MNTKVRLAVMNFLEFAVWGAYLTCMGNYLGIAGLGEKISWFYAIQGIVSIFMPTLMGIVADKYIQPQRLLGLCHLLAGGRKLQQYIYENDPSYGFVGGDNEFTLIDDGYGVLSSRMTIKRYVRLGGETVPDLVKERKWGFKFIGGEPIE